MTVTTRIIALLLRAPGKTFTFHDCMLGGTTSQVILGGVVATQTFSEFSPRKLGKIPILTHIVQMGWFNHQPEDDVDDVDDDDDDDDVDDVDDDVDDDDDDDDG